MLTDIRNFLSKLKSIENTNRYKLEGMILSDLDDINSYLCYIGYDILVFGGSLVISPNINRISNIWISIWISKEINFKCLNIVLDSVNSTLFSESIIVNNEKDLEITSNTLLDVIKEIESISGLIWLTKRGKE